MSEGMVEPDKEDDRALMAEVLRDMAANLGLPKGYASILRNAARMIEDAALSESMKGE